MAREAKVSVSMIESMEQLTRRPSRKNALKIAETLKIDPPPFEECSTPPTRLELKQMIDAVAKAEGISPWQLIVQVFGKVNYEIQDDDIDYGPVPPPGATERGLPPRRGETGEPPKTPEPGHLKES